MSPGKMTITRLDDDDFLIHYACDLRSQSDKIQFVKTDTSWKIEAPDEVPTIVRLGRAQAILDMMMSGTYSSRKVVADTLGITTSTVSRILNFAFVSPEIIERYLQGEISAARVTEIADSVHSMPFWAEQHKALGVGQGIVF